MPSLLADLLLALGLFFSAAVSQGPPREFALPSDEECPIDLPGERKDWTEPEHWAWQQVCLGRTADMREANGVASDGLACNPADIEGNEPPHRKLRPEFLQLILTRERWVEALAKPQVKIRCASVQEQLDLENAKIAPTLSTLSSHFPAGANLQAARFERALSFQGSTFERPLQANNMLIGGNFLLRNEGSFRDVDLVGAKVEGSLDASGSTFEGRFYAENLSVEGILVLSGKGSFQEVVLRGADVGGGLAASGSTFSAPLNADNLSVGGSLLLEGGAVVKGVSLISANVRGNVSTQGSIFEGPFRGDGMSIGGNFFLLGGASFQDVNLIGASVAGEVSAAGSTFNGLFRADRMSVGGGLFLRAGALLNDVSLSGAVVAGHLQLAGSRFEGVFDFSGGKAQELVLFLPSIGADRTVQTNEPHWGEKARLILRNAEVEALQSRISSWQTDQRWVPTDLSGFTYQRLAGFSGQLADTLLVEEAEGLVEWLEGTNNGDDTYDPQPYEQLTTALTSAGMTAKADAVRYAKFRHRDKTLAGNRWEKWLLRPASRLVIGYGAHPIYAFYWFVGLVLIGFLFAYLSTSSIIERWYEKFWYSLECALPLVEFSEQHKTIDHGNGWVESWFHFQKVMGFVLATVLVGALTLLGG